MPGDLALEQQQRSIRSGRCSSNMLRKVVDAVQALRYSSPVCICLGCSSFLTCHSMEANALLGM